jgi:hypothetical protein
MKTSKLKIVEKCIDGTVTKHKHKHRPLWIIDIKGGSNEIISRLDSKVMLIADDGTSHKISCKVA